MLATGAAEADASPVRQVRFRRDSEAWKHARWDAGLKLPTQTQDGRARCFCGADITIANTDAHIRAAHGMTDEQIR
jgi:hypothetical protein